MSIYNIKDFVDTAPYKEMYLKIVRAVRDAEDMHRKADQILIEAMQECEEMYINSEEENNKDVR